ncbi:hypothetical protein ES705_46560 [subsurface metagenome]
MPVSQYKYPKQHVAVDCIIFGYEDDKLKLLLSQRKFEPAKGKWSLMGGWVAENETVEKAAERVLFQITGLKDIYLEQVHVFSKPQRDPGGRVISTAFYAMIRIDKHDKDLVEEHGARWWKFDRQPNLIFDHNQMVKYAHEKLKLKASYELIGANLLPGKFTILQLRTLYQAIFQRQIDPGNFRKKIFSLKVLERLNDKNTSDSKKGAYYYQFRKYTEELVNERIVKL